ncbi:MAG: hypothetical protein ACXWC6_04895 [Ramlibacter sp.]
MRSRTFLSFVLLLCTAYAAATSAYADEATAYWAERAMLAPESSSPIALCVSAFALTITLVLRLTDSRRLQQEEFDSETLVLPCARRQVRRR